MQQVLNEKVQLKEQVKQKEEQIVELDNFKTSLNEQVIRQDSDI